MIRFEVLESEKYRDRPKVIRHKVNPIVPITQFSQQAVMGPIDQPLRRMKDSRRRGEWFGARAKPHSNCYAEVTVTGTGLDVPSYDFVVLRASATATPEVHDPSPGCMGRGTDLYLATARALALAEAERVWSIA